MASRGPELKEEIAAFERAGPEDACGGTVIGIEWAKNVQEMHRMINRELQNPRDRFKYKVGLICSQLNAEGIFDIGRNLKNTICTLADRIPENKIRYFNPSAYVLGYLATNGGRIENKLTVNNVLNKINLIEDDTVKKPDVIRYMRYLLKLNL